MSDQVFTLAGGQAVKLGRIRPKARPPALPLARYLKPEVLAALPDTFDNGAKASASIREMYGNDVYGDCVIAGKMHSVGIWTGNDAGSAAVGTTAEAVNSYHTICGPGDNGCVITDVLDYMKSHGLSVGGKPHRIDGYVSVNWQSQDQLKAAIYLFGAVTIGFECMEKWLSQKVWNLNPGGQVAGGHDVTLLGWNATGVLLSSWGSLYTMTWAAVQSTKYVDEAYAILSPDWYGSDNLSPQHIDVVSLKADLAIIGGGTLPPIPSPTPTPTPTPAPTPTPTPTPATVTLLDQPSVLTSMDKIVNGQHGTLTIKSHTTAVWTPR